MQTPTTNTSNRFYIYLIFLLSPIFSVILAAIRYKEVWAKNVIWLFGGYFGFTFVIGNAKSDVNRYKEQFESFISLRTTFSQFTYDIIYGRDAELDFLQPLISYVVSQFTDNFRYALLVFGFIFAFFLSRNIWNVLSFAKGRLKIYSIFFIIVFSFIYAIWDINVLRFSLAAHIFFYGAFNLLAKEKKWGWIFMAISPLMHFTFGMPLIALFLYKMIIGNRPVIFFIFFISSFFISELDLNALKSNLTFLPQSYQEKSEGYVNENYKENREQSNEEKNFRGKYYQAAIKWATALLLINIYTRRKNIKKEKIWYNYMCFCLFYFSIFNVLSAIPVMKRFLFTGYLLLIPLIFVYYQNFAEKKDRKILYIAVPMLAFYFIMKFRTGLEFIGLFTVLGGPIPAFFNEGDIALINFLK